MPGVHSPAPPRHEAAAPSATSQQQDRIISSGSNTVTADVRANPLALPLRRRGYGPVTKAQLSGERNAATTAMPNSASTNNSGGSHTLARFAPTAFSVSHCGLKVRPMLKPAMALAG